MHELQSYSGDSLVVPLPIEQGLRHTSIHISTFNWNTRSTTSDRTRINTLYPILICNHGISGFFICEIFMMAMIDVLATMNPEGDRNSAFR